MGHPLPTENDVLGDCLTSWPRAPVAMWGGDETALTLCFTDGIATWVDGEIDYRIRTQIDHAVAGPDGNIYATQAGRILCLDGDPLSARDVTDSFGGPAAPDGRVVLGSGGQVYIQGCRSYRRLAGGFAQLPADDEPDPLLPPVACLNTCELLPRRRQPGHTHLGRRAC